MKRLIQNMVVALFYLTTAFRIVALPKNGKNWAVLISGGVGYRDYSLQADICHAYQILHKNGIPDQRIIVMMGDEIARHKNNTKPGIIINKPGGPNVYKNVPKDYTGKNVNPDNFVGILLGKVKSGIGSGKVLKSGPNDNVFIFFSGHGNNRIIAVGKKTLGATKLIETLRTMHKKRRYRKMLFYLNSCHSGSMFNKKAFGVRMGIYATTASCSKENAWMTVYDKTLKTIVASEYSFNWMEHSEKNDLNAITVGQQFEKVRQLTNRSVVQEFGDKSIKKLKVAEFLGNRKKT